MSHKCSLLIALRVVKCYKQLAYLCHTIYAQVGRRPCRVRSQVNALILVGEVPQRASRTMRCGGPEANIGRWWESFPTRPSSIARRESTKRQRSSAGSSSSTLQFDVKDWIALGTTKTGMVYRMNGGAPHSVEMKISRFGARGSDFQAGSTRRNN